MCTVEGKLKWKVLVSQRLRRFVFPTAESPIMITEEGK
jgi:hypothetical protein